MSDTQTYLDPTVLSGDSPSGGAFDVTPPMAAPGQQSPTVPPADTTAPAAPDINGTPAGVAPTTPIGNGQTAGPAAPAQNPPVWRTILQGALWGLANSGGSTHFGGGLAAGAAGVIKGKQQELENAQNAQKLQFESVRAADSHIQALDEHKRADQLSTEGKLDYKMKSAQYQQFLQDNFGVEPNLSFNDSSTQANAGLQTLSQSNSGQIPSVSTVQHPEPDGTHGKISVYSPTQQQLQQNSSGFRKLIDTQRAVQGLPPIDDRSFNSLGFKGQRDASNAAIEFLKPTVNYTLDKNSASYLPNVLAQKQQQLDQYQAHKDANGNVDANPAVVSQLKSQVDFLNKAWSSSNQMENAAQVSNIQATAGPKAVAAAQQTKAETLAKESTPGGKLELAQKRSEIAKNNAAIEATSNKPIYAYNTQTKQTEQTTKAEMTASPGKFSNPVDVKEADLRKDKDLTRQLGDAQLNLSRYRVASDGIDNLPIVQKTAIASLLKSDKFKASFMGAEIPVDYMNQLDNVDSWNYLSPQAKDAVIGYIATRGAVIAYQKAVSGSGRSNKEQLELELQNIPSPILSPDVRAKQLDRFQQNIDQTGAALPKLVGMESPKEIRQRIEKDTAKGATHVYDPNSGTIQKTGPAPMTNPIWGFPKQ